MRDFGEWAEYSKDPYGFVLGAFPWDGGHSLINGRFPEPWQRELLQSIGTGLLTPEVAIREAAVSGNGVGKSTLVAWIILWALVTREDTRGVITANTETQLKTKTWAELGKWFNLFEGRDYLKLTATAIYTLSLHDAHERTWRIDMVPWS